MLKETRNHVSTVAAERLPSMLRAGGPTREAASQELRDLLVRAALAYLARQRYPAKAFGADCYATVAEDYAHEALLIVLRQIDTFQGDSKFTTWAFRIVINLMADDARRRLWRHHPLPEEGMENTGRHTLPDEVSGSAERRELSALVDHIIRDELTPRQRQALVGRMVEEKPLVVLAAELNTTKDNVYKLIHDARKHVKRALQERGLTGADVLAVFARTQ